MARYRPSAADSGGINIDRAVRPDRTPFNSNPIQHLDGTIYGPNQDETVWARRAVHHYAKTPAEAADWLAMLNLTETP